MKKIARTDRRTEILAKNSAASAALRHALNSDSDFVGFLMLRNGHQRRDASLFSIDIQFREEFVRIHSEPILPNFLKEQMKAHPNLDLPALPAAGGLDIRQVPSSPYFFA